MRIYIDLIWVALITIFIVDLSGFTDTWLTALSHYRKKRIVSFKPFDCSLCMTWWCCLVFALCTGHFCLPVIAFSALLAFLAYPIGQLMTFIREWILSLINKLIDLL